MYHYASFPNLSIQGVGNGTVSMSARLKVLVPCGKVVISDGHAQGLDWNNISGHKVFTWAGRNGLRPSTQPLPEALDLG